MDALSWVAEAGALYSTWLYGTPGYKGPVVGFLCNIPWLALSLLAGFSGMAIGSLAFMAVHIRNGYMFWKGSK